MKKNIPTYEFIIDETLESGVKAISIVSDPAFQSKLIAFAAIKSTFVALADIKGKKRKVCGLALIPNTPVFRIDDLTGEEYYGFFSAETIEKIVEKFHAENNNNHLNLNHNDNAFVDAILVEDFIVDSQERVEDLKKKGITHENIMGAWSTTYKIKSEEVFNSILNGGSKVGFSVECYLDKIISKLSEQINKSNLKIEMKKNNKTLLERIMKIFSEESFERSLVPELAITIEWGSVGEQVNQVVVDEAGNETLAPVGPGEFSTDAGIIVVDEASNLLEVRPLPEQPEPVLEVAPAPVVASLEDDSIKLPEEELVDPVAEVSPDMMPPDGTDPNAPPTPDVKAKTIGEIVGTSDGEYYIKVCVEGGIITEAEVSSETNLLKTSLEEVQKENSELKDKLKEPIGEPILAPVPEKKDWNKMSTYERVLERTRKE